MRFTLVLAVGGAGAGWGGLWLDIVGIDEGQTQLTGLVHSGFFFVLSEWSDGWAVTELL